MAKKKVAVAKKEDMPGLDVPIRRKCGAMAVHYRLLEDNPDFGQNLVAQEKLVARRMAGGAARRSSGPITIPVVVHVVSNTADQDISEAQIRSQIDVLNLDYRARNPDRGGTPSVWAGLVSDAGLEFELATIDPAGHPTGGITRTTTATTSFVNDDAVKSAATGGADPWPSANYLNIWACNLGGGLLGYAQFPGGPAATDGVVILYQAFGTTGTVAPPFNLGRTTTHEVGHWLNLYHIWGDTSNCSGTDFVDDTPNQQSPNYGKPTFPHISCGNGPNGDMFMNYMDYVDDDSMFMFTTQQVARINATFDGPRNTIGLPKPAAPAAPSRVKRKVKPKGPKR